MQKTQKTQKTAKIQKTRKAQKQTMKKAQGGARPVAPMGARTTGTRRTSG